MSHELSNIFLEIIIDFAVTIIVIDRLLNWRERRRWKAVRTFVELQLEAVLGDILRAWSMWLIELRKSGKKIVFSKEAKILLKDDYISSSTSLGAEDFEVFVELCAGESVPEIGEKSFVDQTIPNNFHKELSGYLVNLSLDDSNAGWKTLVNNLQSLVHRLAELAERLPRDKITNDEIGYIQFIEELNLLIRKIDPSLYPSASWNNEFVRLNRMTEIARSIVGIILLIRVFRTSRHTW